MVINIDPSCGRTMNLVKVLGSSPGLDVTIVPGGSAGHRDWCGPCSSMAFGYQHGSRWQPSPPPSAWSSMVSGAADISTDPDGRVMDPDMALAHNPGPDYTMTPVDSIDQPSLPHTNSSTTLRYQHGHSLWPRSQASMWALAATWTRDINRGLSCRRTMYPDMDLGSSPGCRHGSQWPCRPPRLVWPLRQHSPQTSM